MELREIPNVQDRGVGQIQRFQEKEKAPQHLPMSMKSNFSSLRKNDKIPHPDRQLLQSIQNLQEIVYSKIVNTEQTHPIQIQLLCYEKDESATKEHQYRCEFHQSIAIEDQTMKNENDLKNSHNYEIARQQRSQPKRAKQVRC